MNVVVRLDSYGHWLADGPDCGGRDRGLWPLSQRRSVELLRRPDALRALERRPDPPRSHHPPGQPSRSQRPRGELVDPKRKAPGDAPLLRQNQGSPRGKARHRGRRAQTLPPPPRHRAERSAVPSQLQPNEGELSFRRAIETLPGGGNRVVSRDPRRVASKWCGAAPDPNKRPVASTTNRMLKLLAPP